MCRLLITSPIVPDVCKSISELLPSAFKNGIVADDTVPTVIVSVEASPVILIRPDESKFNVSDVESATTFVESFRLIVEKAFPPLLTLAKLKVPEPSVCNT